jgi:hypothetical protein
MIFLLGTKRAGVPSKIDRTVNPHWLDYALRFEEGTPNFDVLQRTINFGNTRTSAEAVECFDDEYVFRGPIIGPITNADVRKTQRSGFQIPDALSRLGETTAWIRH